MTAIVSTRAALRLGVATGALALALVPTAAYALDPLPLPSPLAPVNGLLASPSPSPSATPLAPVVSALPEPVASPVRAVLSTTPTTAPAPAPVPAPAAAPAAPAPVVRPNQQAAPQQVAAPGTGVAAFPGLQAGSFANNATRSSGLAPLTAGMASATMNRLLGVPNVAQPPAELPAAAPAASHDSTVPGGLPVVAVLVAAVTLGGVAVSHVGVLRTQQVTSSS